MKRIITLITILAGLAFAGSASAFSGPWNSAHQPPTIHSPLVHVTRDNDSDLTIRLDDKLLCPADGTVGGSTPPQTATLTVIDSPSRSVTYNFLPRWHPYDPNHPFAGDDGGCANQVVQELDTGHPDFLDTSGLPVGVSFDQNKDLSLPARIPFFFTVTTPTSGVIAQDSYTWVYIPPGEDRTIWEDTDFDEFINICLGPSISGIYVSGIQSENGRLYCTTSEGTDSGVNELDHGWPKPPSLPSMNTQVARQYSTTVLKRIGYAKHINGTHTQNLITCNKRISPTEIRCSAFWRYFTRGEPTFRGSINVWYAWNSSHKVVRHYRYDITRQCSNHVKCTKRYRSQG